MEGNNKTKSKSTQRMNLRNVQNAVCVLPDSASAAAAAASAAAASAAAIAAFDSVL